MSTDLHYYAVPEDLADQIRRALAKVAEDLPAGAGARVRARHYRPRASVVTHAAGAAAAVAAISVGAYVVGQTAGHSGGRAAEPSAQELVAHTQRALSATTDVFHLTWVAGNDSRVERWSSPDGTRVRELSAIAGYLEEVGYVAEGSQLQTTVANYDERWFQTTTQARSSRPPDPDWLTIRDGLVIVGDRGLPGAYPSAGPAAPRDIAQALQAGRWTRTGTTTVDGRAAYVLTRTVGSITTTMTVDEESHLPVGMQLSGEGVTSSVVVQWLPPTAANVDLETLHVPPGFRQIPSGQ